MPSTPQVDEPNGEKLAPTAKWMRRLIISLTFLAWLVLVIIVFRLLGFISASLLILVIAGLIAYAVQPLVQFFQKVMPRALAILIVYLVILGILGFLFYLLIVTSIAQISSLAKTASTYFMPSAGKASPLFQVLHRFGVTQAQMSELSQAIGNQLTSIAENTAKNVLPLITGIASGLVNILITAVVSIYLLVDGARAVRWIRKNSPLPIKPGTTRLLESLRNVVGGYIRGQFILCAILGILVGLGMFILHVPYAVFLGTLAGFLEFIPVLGTIASGVICCLLALTQGWLTFILALGYFVLLHVFEGYVLAPRIVGKAVGLHPVVSLLALIAGGELFGPLGVILASPVAGLIQSILFSFWLYYREGHKEQFAGGEEQSQEAKK